MLQNILRNLSALDLAEPAFQHDIDNKDLAENIVSKTTSPPRSILSSGSSPISIPAPKKAFVTDNQIDTPIYSPETAARINWLEPRLDDQVDRIHKYVKSVDSSRTLLDFRKVMQSSELMITSVRASATKKHQHDAIDDQVNKFTEKLSSHAGDTTPKIDGGNLDNRLKQASLLSAVNTLRVKENIWKRAE